MEQFVNDMTIVVRYFCRDFNEEQYNIQLKSLPHNSNFNPSPNGKILNMTKLKAFADDRLNVGRTMIYLLD